jgi:hypothetical protein
VSHSHPMPMDTLNTLLPTRSSLSMMCNGCMSGRVRNSTPCWPLNGKQLLHGQLQGKLVGTSSYRAHVDQRLPYDKLNLDDASMSSMYLELM